MTLTNGFGGLDGGLPIRLTCLGIEWFFYGRLPQTKMGGHLYPAISASKRMFAQVKGINSFFKRLSPISWCPSSTRTNAKGFIFLLICFSLTQVEHWGSGHVTGSIKGNVQFQTNLHVASVWINYDDSFELLWHDHYYSTHVQYVPRR